MMSGEVMRKTILDVLESGNTWTQKDIAERLQKNMRDKEAKK